MKKLYSLILVMISLSLTAQDPPEVLWSHTYPMPDFDRAYNVVDLADGTYVMAGYTRSYGSNGDFLILKTNEAGDILWQNYFGGSDAESFSTMIQDSDGNFILSGNTQSFSNSRDAYVVKVGSTGQLIWEQVYGGSDSDGAGQIIEENDGYLILGGTTSDPGESITWMIKLNKASGNPIEENIYPDTPAKGVIIEDDGYVFFGYGANEFVYSDADFRLKKISFNNDVVWDQYFDNGLAEVGEAFCKSPDGGYIMTGVTYRVQPLVCNIWVVKADASGNKVWSKSYGGLDFDEPFDIAPTADGGYVISGYSQNYGDGSDDLLLLKLNANGDSDWITVLEDPGVEWGAEVVPQDDGGYLVAGSNALISNSDADFYLLRFGAPPLSSNFSASPTTICNGSPVIFGPVAFGTGVSYNWTFDIGGGNSYQSSESNPVVTYPLNGIFDVTLEVTRESETLSETKAGFITVQDAVPAFTGAPRSVLEGQGVSFTDISPCGVSSRLWDFAGGTTDDYTVVDPIVTFSSPGTYDVSLEVNGEFTETETGYITVYCPSSGDPSRSWISVINSGGTNHETGAEGYGDFSSLTFVFSALQPTSLTLYPDQQKGKPISHYWKAWIDFDKDGIFEDEEVVLSTGKIKNEATGEVIVPTDFSGTSRMRVSMNEDAPPQPCDINFMGEVQDYTIYVQEATPQAPIASFTADPTNINEGDYVQFTDMSQNFPDTWDWTFEHESGNPILTSGDQNPEIQFTVAGSYDVTLVASNPEGSDTEIRLGYITVEEAGQQTLCEPVNVQNSIGRYINSITIDTTESITGQGQVSGFPAGYLYYADRDFWFTPGVPADVTLEPANDRDRYFWRIWIDLTGDNDFEDEGELVFIANNKKGIITGEILVPEGEYPETTRMRVTMKLQSAPSGSCDDDFIGEVEDYNAMIAAASTNSSYIQASRESVEGFRIYPNPVSDDMLTIEANGAWAAARFEIFTSRGSEIRSLSLDRNTTTLDISSFSPGIYYYRLTAGDRIIAGKLVRN